VFGAAAVGHECVHLARDPNARDRRDELLNEESFEDLAHARRLLERWRIDYN